jgi:(+)-pinoresinol hydroxylase
MRLPPGVSSKDFSAAIQQFEMAIGKDWVFTADADVALYRDPYSPFRGEEEEERVPSAAVAPANVEEVQAVVKIANQYKIPLWPVSTGKNLGYGGTSPVLSGTPCFELLSVSPTSRHVASRPAPTGSEAGGYPHHRFAANEIGGTTKGLV